MSKQRRTHSDVLKAKVAIEVLKGEKGINEIAALYEIHPNLALKWKRELEENAKEAFVKGKRPEDIAKDEKIEELYKQLGKRDLELDWVKKKLGL